MHGWQYQERYCPHVMTYTVLQNPAKFPHVSVSKIIQFIHVIDMININLSKFADEKNNNQ